MEKYRKLADNGYTLQLLAMEIQCSLGESREIFITMENFQMVFDSTMTYAALRAILGAIPSDWFIGRYFCSVLHCVVFIITLNHL